MAATFSAIASIAENKTCGICGAILGMPRFLYLPLINVKKPMAWTPIADPNNLISTIIAGVKAQCKFHQTAKVKQLDTYCPWINNKEGVGAAVLEYASQCQKAIISKCVLPTPSEACTQHILAKYNMDARTYTSGVMTFFAVTEHYGNLELPAHEKNLVDFTQKVSLVHTPVQTPIQTPVQPVVEPVQPVIEPVPTPVHTPVKSKPTILPLPSEEDVPDHDFKTTIHEDSTSSARIIEFKETVTNEINADYATIAIAFEHFSTIQLNEAWTSCSREYRAETIIAMSSVIADLEKEYSDQVKTLDEQVKANTEALAKIASSMAVAKPAVSEDTSEMKAMLQQLLNRPIVVESKEAADSKALIEQMTKEAVQSKALLEQIMMEAADSKTRINELLARKPVASKVAKETIAKVLEIATSVEKLCLTIDTNETDLELEGCTSDEALRTDIKIAKRAFYERNRKAKAAMDKEAKARAAREAEAKAAKEAKIKAAREAKEMADKALADAEAE
jgi:hypothetical protein